MSTREIRPGIHWVGVDDLDLDLFEGLWPLDGIGVSYNAYLIDDERKALIDVSDGSKPAEFLAQVSRIIDPRELDYVVINHMEPDHTGALTALREVAPQAELLASKKAVGMMASFYGIEEGARAVADGETLSLGRHILRFVSTPFLHWPETMMTFDETEGVLFSCDAFGAYGALHGGLFVDEHPDLAAYEREALRYYANIVALYPKPVQKALDRLSGVPVQVVAPSHGRVWRQDPGTVVDWYRRWAGYAEGPQELGVTLLYGSMHGNTERVAHAVACGVERAGVPVEVFDVRRAHASYILPSLYTRKAVLVGCSTYEGGIFPPIAAILHWAEHKRMLGRKAAYFGSHGWSGGAQREFLTLAAELQWEVRDGWEFAGGASPRMLELGEAFGYRFGRSLLDA